MGCMPTFGKKSFCNFSESVEQTVHVDDLEALEVEVGNGPSFTHAPVEKDAKRVRRRRENTPTRERCRERLVF